MLALIFLQATVSLRQICVRASRAGALAGLCLFSGYVLQTFGLKYTSASKTGFLTGLYIPLVPLFSAVVYKKITANIRTMRGRGGLRRAWHSTTIQTNLLEKLIKATCWWPAARQCMPFAYLLLGHFRAYRGAI